MSKYQIGWGSADITPRGGASSLEGQFETRITEEVKRPLMAICMMVQSVEATSIWVSCDANHIFKSLSEQVEARLSEEMEGFRPGMLMMSATHIHTGPYHDRGGWLSLTGDAADDPGAMTAEEYRSQMADGIVHAVLAARADLKPSRIELAIAPVITGVSRRVVYSDGTAKMYGSMDPDNFYRMEARDGGPTQLLYVYAEDGALTGVVADVPCPAQCDEHAMYITGDYWSVVRERIRASWGEGVTILPLIRSAGDLSPHPMVDRLPDNQARQTGPGCCEYMGNWVADTIEMFRNRPFRPLPGQVHRHVSEILTLPVWKVSPEEYAAAKAYMKNPSNFKPDGKPVSTFDYANAWTRIRRVERDAGTVETRINATRLDDVVLLSVPFELYQGYMDRIRRRVPQTVVFDVELTYDNLGYLATREGVAGGHYSACIFNGVCSPEAGEIFVEECARVIRSLL